MMTSRESAIDYWRGLPQDFADQPQTKHPVNNELFRILHHTGLVQQHHGYSKGDDNSCNPAAYQKSCHVIPPRVYQNWLVPIHKRPFCPMTVLLVSEKFMYAQNTALFRLLRPCPRTKLPISGWTPINSFPQLPDRTPRMLPA